MHLLYYLYLSVLLTVFMSSLYRFNILDKASRVLSLLTGLTFLAETIAFCAAKAYHNNMAVYAVFNPVQALFYALYFNYAVDVFRERHLGIRIGFIMFMLGMLNLLIFQSPNHMDSYFLILEGLVVIGMSLFAFYRLLLYNCHLRVEKNPHFWFIVILAFFWTITFLNWGLYEYINLQYAGYRWMLNLFIICINIFFYAAIGIVFFLYPKMNSADGK